MAGWRARWGVVVCILMARALAQLTALGPLPASWSLQFQDEFDGAEINTDVWNVWNNQVHEQTGELEVYMGYNVYVGNGTLTLETQRQQQIYDGEPYSYPVLYNFTSGYVDTSNKFFQQYGRFEVRAMLPNLTVNAIWPAHWLMPNSDICWPTGGEIDFMEAVGGPVWGNEVKGTLHYGHFCDNNLYTGGNFYDYAPPLAFDQSFHTYGVEWTESALQWFVDGQVYFTLNSSQVPIPTLPFYLILNTAVAPFGNATQEDAVFPVYHVIDYVRIYGAPPPPPQTPPPPKPHTGLLPWQVDLIIGVAVFVCVVLVIVSVAIRRRVKAQSDEYQEIEDEQHPSYQEPIN